MMQPVSSPRLPATAPAVARSAAAPAAPPAAYEAPPQDAVTFQPAPPEPAPAAAAPVEAPPAKEVPPPPPVTLRDAGPQFSLPDPKPTVAKAAGNAPQVIADILAHSDDEVEAIYAQIAQSQREAAQRSLDLMRGGGASASAGSSGGEPAAPEAPMVWALGGSGGKLSSSQKSTMDKLVKSGVNSDYARRLVSEGDQYKIQLLSK